MGIGAFIKNLVAQNDDVDLEQELLDWKYPFVIVTCNSSERVFDMVGWLWDNVGEEDYYFSSVCANVSGKSAPSRRVFFTHSNDAMGFKLAYGYD